MTINRYIWQMAGMLLFAVNVAIAQVPSNKPNNTSGPAPTVNPVPGAYPVSLKINSIRTHEVLEPMSDIATVESQVYNPTRRDSKVRDNAVYFDGLGRKLQMVQRMFSPNYDAYYDLVSPVIYDELGRESFQYIPFATNGDGTYGGSFHRTPFASQKYFLENLNGAQGGPVYPGENVFYSKTEFEASPLNRITKFYPAGNSWAGNGVGTTQKYLINTASDAVRIWTITNNSLTYFNEDENTNIPISAGAYAPGELYKNVSIDENNNAIVEYKDKNGLVILKKVQLSNTIPSGYSGHDGWLCTYYVYDDFNQLRFVIAPKAVEAIKSTWSISSEIAKELCFRYEYDERHRQIAKKIPGAGWVYMVYDKRDRLIYSQDANMRGNSKWLTTLYDEINRAIMTGMISYTGNRDDLQSYVSQQSGGGFEQQVAMPQPQELQVSERNPGENSYVATESITFTEFESESDAEFTAEIIGESSSTESVSVSGPALPPASDFVALTITYFDDYNWNQGGNKQFSNADNSKLSYTSSYFNRYLDDVPQQSSQFTTGIVTGTRTRVLENPANLSEGNWLTSLNYYDHKGRLVQSQTDNYKGGIDMLTTRYDFKGLAFVTYLVHHNPAAGNDRVRIKTLFEYDHNDRLYSIRKQLNDGPEKLLETLDYTYLGQAKSKSLRGGEQPNTEIIHSADFSYNIRGWLQGMNKDFLNGSPQASPESWFGFELNYDKGFANNQFNGNIAGMKWKSAGDGERRAYGFGYDRANRILSGDFSQYDGSNYVDNSTINFDMVMGNGSDASTAYDANGNILAMKQWGLKVNTSTLIDDLGYTYYANSNKLRSVSDAVNDVTSKLGDFVKLNSSGGLDEEDYSYDANGNLTIDYNKSLVKDSTWGQFPNIAMGFFPGITYNHLNLPWEITKRVPNTNSTQGKIVYIYDASGNKLEKRVTEVGKPGINKTSYLSGFVYQNDKLQFFGHEEGRVRLAKQYYLNGDSAEKYFYDYFLKDHLGNVRMVLTEQKDTAQYVATMETAYREKEENLFYNIPETQFSAADVPGGYPVDTSVTNPNLLVSKLNGSDKKLGPSLVLKVMSGDKIDIGVKSFYRPQGSAGTNQDPLTDILNALATGIVSATGESKGTLAQLSNPTSSPLLGALNSFRTNNNQDPVGKPKAYLNWILLDEQFKLVNSYPQTGAILVGNADQLNTLGQSGINVSKTGYLYIYVSNETQNWNVFFDNLAVKHYTGALLEETHYYPYGLTMAGISSKALKANYSENKYKYNGIEKEDGLGIEMYDAQLRELNPQIGRWWQIDPEIESMEMWSPYASNYDNPIRYSDPLGDEGQACCRGGLDYVFKGVGNVITAGANWVDKSFSFGTKTKVETTLVPKPGENSSSTLVVETTVETRTNLGGVVSALENSSRPLAGNELPDFTRTTVETTVSAEKGVEIKTPVGTVSGKGSIDNNGVATVEGGFEVQPRPGVTVGGSVSRNSNGDKEIKVTGSVGTDKVKATSSLSYTQNNQNGSSNVQFSFGGESKVGNVKVVTLGFVKYTIDKK